MNCPFCAEKINDEALICKFCKKTLTSGNAVENGGILEPAEFNTYIPKTTRETDSTISQSKQLKSASNKKRVLIVSVLILIVASLGIFQVNSNIQIKKRLEAEKIALALKSYVPYSYVDLIDTYGTYGPEYEAAMGRYTEANKCEYISETISAFQNLDHYFELVYNGVPGVRVIAKKQDILIGSSTVNNKMSDILKYSSIKGTKGEIAIRGLTTLAASLDSKIYDDKLTRNDWFTLKSVLIGWHSPELIDESLRDCVVSQIQNNGWKP